MEKEEVMRKLRVLKNPKEKIDYLMRIIDSKKNLLSPETTRGVYSSLADLNESLYRKRSYGSHLSQLFLAAGYNERAGELDKAREQWKELSKAYLTNITLPNVGAIDRVMNHLRNLGLTREANLLKKKTLERIQTTYEKDRSPHTVALLKHFKKLLKERGRKTSKLEATLASIFFLASLGVMAIFVNNITGFSIYDSNIKSNSGVGIILSLLLLLLAFFFFKRR